MQTLSQMLGGLSMPIVRGCSLWVATDYSFDNAASDFDVIGVLIADPGASGQWNDLRREVRSRLLSDRRSMSWKKLNSDSQRQAALFPFLLAADHLPRLMLGPAELLHRQAGMPYLGHVDDLVTLELHDIDVVGIVRRPVGGTGPPAPVWVPWNTP
jgi:hypothetical protein